MRSAISKAEKAEIRARLLDSGLDESNARLAIHNALVIAKIIRIEYPLDWFAVPHLAAKRKLIQV